MNMTKIDFELACAAGLNVCTGGESTFNNQVVRFAAAVRAPLLAEIGALRAELAKTKAPACPAGMIEHGYCAGTSTWGVNTSGARGTTTLICHLEHTPGLPETEIDPAVPAKMELFAAYHGAVNVLDTLLKPETVLCIELEALQDLQS